MSYKTRNQKQITLPSGAKCVIRKLRAEDFQGIGKVPLLFSEPKRNGVSPKAEEMKPEDIEWVSRFGEAILTKCVSPLDCDGEKLRIVDCPFHECSDGEISIEVLDQADAAAIISAVQELSGLGKEAGEQARTFPEGTEAAQHRSPAASNGAHVSPATDGVACVAAG
jgi:hypothetical protein